MNLVDINNKLKSGVIKPIDLVNEAFSKIESSNLNCFITLNKEEAMRKAKELEKCDISGLLFGVPIIVKDNIVTKNLKTTAGSFMLNDFIPIYDATVVSKLLDAGCIIIGKANMDEFAMGSTGETSYYGNTLNPIDNNLTAGGSSSGTAACVGSDITCIGLGSDTGGSIRQPASFCGIVGMKPTYGSVSRYGLISFASSFDTIGPMTRCVYDNAVLLNCISGIDSNDLTSYSKNKDNTSLIGEDVKGLKIAIPKFYVNDKIDKDVLNRFNVMVDKLKTAGCVIEYVDLDYLEYSISLYQILALGEASSNLSRFDGIKYGHCVNGGTLTEMLVKSRSEGFGDEVKRRILVGTHILSGVNAKIYYDKALRIRKAMTDSFSKIFESYDLVIGPTNTSVAYPLGLKCDDALKTFVDDVLTIPFNLTGMPALSLPIGFKGNLPIGMQIGGNYYNEDIIYKLASFVEEVK